MNVFIQPGAKLKYSRPTRPTPLCNVERISLLFFVQIPLAAYPQCHPALMRACGSRKGVQFGPDVCRLARRNLAVRGER